MSAAMNRAADELGRDSRTAEASGVFHGVSPSGRH
ncbi:MAG: hypothetical protein ACJAVS_001077 [Paracoccaceae bacterium]|jgi:hypothetical protein